MGAVRSGSEFEQTATVAFESGEQRSVQMQYIYGVPPSNIGDEAVAIRGLEKGKLVKLMQKVDDSGEEGMWFVSLVSELVFRSVKGSDMVATWN